MPGLHLIIIFIIFTFNFGENARILGIWPNPGRSHFIVFERLMKALAEKGHEVDVLSQFRQDPKIPRYNDYTVENINSLIYSNISLQMLQEAGYTKLIALLLLTGEVDCRSVFNTSAAHTIKNSKKKYDLLITELFLTDCFLGFAHHFQIPAVMITTSVNLPWGSDRIGNPDNPSYIANYFSPFTNDMNIFQRTVNTFMLLIIKFGYNYFSLRRSNFVAKEFFGQDLPDLYDLVNNVSLILANSHFSLNYARPTVPNLIEVGGLHLEDTIVLPKSYEASLKTDLNGVIYLSMGSILRSETFPNNKLQAMFDAFAEIPYKIIWKANIHAFNNSLAIPENIEFHTWMPQRDILCHPNVKLFVSHGGALSGQEAVYCGVPRLGIPFFAEQTLNIKASASAGIALYLPYEDITKTTFKNAILKLLQDKTYNENCEHIAKLYKDRSQSALSTAVYWIEYVIRYKGAPHLRSKGADLPWYKYLLLDVILLTVTFLIGFCWTIYKMLCILGNYCFKIQAEDKRKSE